jgi:signal transduction histidine kinase
MEELPARVAERLNALTYDERAVAYLQVDTRLALVGAGGHLETYGLAALHLGEPAAEQAFFLEGLLPLVETPYVVQSVEVATGRVADLHFLLDADTVWVVLLDVTADRNAARRMQQKAYDMTLLQEHEALLNRRLEAANAALFATQRELEASREALIGAYDQVQAQAAAAEAALRGLKAAQANLIQAEKMASLGQLTAGIAHEIKNPLNFVNNFANLSVELLDELKETTAPAIVALSEDKRAEVNETIEVLTGNLEKIAEHGRRADGIVKRMLEHSSGGTGEGRSVDLNNLVEEALNLAYHGARAQDQSFNVALERDFVEAIAPIELVPQDVTRVLLNLIGNGFYAATKRRKEGSDPKFKPTVRVSTRDLGDMVEIRVHDNGTGIPPEIKDKLFQPFFTTKSTGEGTGLGLSISYDIVAHGHGGAIEVDSKVGAFTEFTIRLPRDRQAANTSAAA